MNLSRIIIVSGKGIFNESIEYGPVHLPIKFSIYRCYFGPCEDEIKPPPPPTPEPKNKKASIFYWSDPEAWRMAPPGWGGNYGDGTYGLPKDDDNVWILPGKGFCSCCCHCFFFNPEKQKQTNNNKNNQTDMR